MPQPAAPTVVPPSTARLARRLVRAAARRLADRAFGGVLGGARGRRRRARASWLAAAAAGALAAPWVARQAVGTLDGVGDTAAVTAVTAVTAAFDQAAADRLARRGSGRVLGGAGAGGTGRHLGFDTFTFPGEAALRRWKAAGAPYEWVGY